MKVKILSRLLIPMLYISISGCDNNKEQVVALETEIDQQLLEIRNLTGENDNLKTTIYDLQKQLEELEKKSDQVSVISPQEQQIRALVNNVHKGWVAMAATKNTDALLKYFLPKYTTGAVRINTEDIPSAKRSNDTNFEEHLEALINVDGLSLSFGQTDFLYTEVKGNLFATLYRTVVRVYKNNELIHTSSVMSLLAGENRDGWKVGKYSWVTFQYD